MPGQGYDTETAAPCIRAEKWLMWIVTIAELALLIASVYHLFTAASIVDTSASNKKLEPSVDSKSRLEDHIRVSAWFHIFSLISLMTIGTYFSTLGAIRRGLRVSEGKASGPCDCNNTGCGRAILAAVRNNYMLVNTAIVVVGLAGFICGIGAVFATNASIMLVDYVGWAPVTDNDNVLDNLNTAFGTGLATLFMKVLSTLIGHAWGARRRMDSAGAERVSLVGA